MKRSSETDGRAYSVIIDGQDVTWAIRAPEVESGVSQVSAWPGVRHALVAQQRRVAERVYAQLERILVEAAG